MPWFPVCAEADVPAGGCYRAETAGEELLLVKVDGEIHAMSNICSHDYAELSDGELDGHEIVCPLHQARFDARTGEALTPPAYEPLPTFPVRVVDGSVEVEIED
jgi:nitrite reductase/ring-hydroxylating ferredoxin subunit